MIVLVDGFSIDCVKNKWQQREKKKMENNDNETTIDHLPGLLYWAAVILDFSCFISTMPLNAVILREHRFDTHIFRFLNPESILC